MKRINIVLFFLVSFLRVYSMDFELVPLLSKNDLLVNGESDEQHNHAPVKILLVRHMPAFLEAKMQDTDKIKDITKIQNTIIEYMCKPAFKKTDQEIIVDYQKKVALQQEKIVELRQAIRQSIQKKYQCPDEIRCDVNGCIDTARAGTAGACCGTMAGAGGMCIYGEIEGYIWCCCGVAPPKMLWNIFAWGFPISMASGCLIGSLCVLCGVHKKIRCDL